MKKMYGLMRGTVRIRISGVEPHNVLNLCGKESVKFWDISAESEFCTELTVYSFDLARVRRFAMKCGCDVTVIHSSGGKNLAKAAKRRRVFVVCAAVCIALAAVFSMFVWNISVSGNEKLSYGEVLRILNESGVDYGSFWPAISSENVCNEILMNHPEISWLTLNMKNSTVEVIIHERVEKPQIVSEAFPCDVVAEKNGVITKISVLEGQKSVSVGDTVCRGDCLISGIMQSETAEPRQVHAMGTVEARTWYEITAVMPLEKCVKCEKDGGFFKLSLLLGKNQINFFADSRNKAVSCDKINKIGYVSLADVFTLPCGLSIQRGTAYAPQYKTAIIAAEVQRMHDDLMEELRLRIGDGDIKAASFTEAECDGLLVVTLWAECVENIAGTTE